MSKAKGPILIELDDAKAPGPDQAAPISDSADLPQGKAMQSVARLAARPPSALARWFWRLAGSLATLGLSLWAWDTLTALIARNAVLGYGAAALTGAFLVVCLGIVLREWAAFARLRRIDGIKTSASAALAGADLGADLGAARAVTQRLVTLYSGRKDMEWVVGRLRERMGEVLDADGLLGMAENELMEPLDAAARREVEAAARQVAMVTAIVPLALADVATALVANLRMIRRVAEIYGGRAGTLGSWRLARTVMTHLVATGAVAVGDDLIHSIAGGGVLSKLSRRFGEGMINGALTARVGVAAMEVCRPLPFRTRKRPSITSLVQRALAGLFSSK